jgi:hypothetical protein
VSAKIEHFLYVLTVNGEVIRRTQIDFPVGTWGTWTNPKGEDFIVMADDNGKLFAFEVFWCEIGDGFYRCRSPLVTIVYASDIGCVVAAAKDGRVIFVPHEL